MQTLRVEMRANRPPELTVPQFRTLAFYEAHAGAALSDAAEHLGLGAPSASKVVESLVARGLLVRGVSASDRRRVVIALTNAGEQVLVSSRSEATEVFARRFKRLSELELSVLFAVLGTLQSVMGSDGPEMGGPEVGGSGVRGVAADSPASGLPETSDREKGAARR
ncbi:MAG: MarR family winged helix-turn-helix transcriptional regulator [Humidesulfovibrio sp.]|nr:MarR family winged helix-turn-helix transcriptional regulator [Humidesulfovibrio sp.]